jgi:2-hydroxy-6-oxonona-2,4-dienedioate hydrolase
VEKLSEQTIEVAGRPTRLLRGGKAGAPFAVFVHGGLPGVTPYCSGAHIWGEALLPFLDRRQVVALDMPGSGGTSFGNQPFSVEMLARHVVETMSALGTGPADLVVHDVGGIVGLWLALDAPERLRTLSIVASLVAAPQGDGLDSILLTAPPAPLWGRESQAWALERLSYSHLHLRPDLIGACVRAGEGEAHAQAAAAEESSRKTFAASVGKAKYRLWETVRGDGISVPTQLVWGSHDPTVSREAGYVLFTAIARKQPATQFHILNRAGNFPFREQPEAFHHVIASFQEGVHQEASYGAS